MLKFAILLFSIFSCPAFAQFNGKIDLSLRTKPMQYNGMLTGAYDGMLWGEVDKTKGMYGFYRAGLKLGGSPTAAAFLQVAPIAPVVFEILSGPTYRFLKTSVTDCTAYECLQKIDRTDYSVKLGGAYKDFVLVSKFTLRDIQTESGSKSIFLEAELFHVAPGHYYRYFENTTVAGYKIDEKLTVGLLYNGGELTGSGARFNSGYAIYMRKMEWAELMAGLGYMENSSVPDEVRGRFRGVSGLLSLSKSYGDSLALF